MHRLISNALVLAGLFSTTVLPLGAASAAEPSGLRPLTWAGRPAPTAPQSSATAPTTAPATVPTEAPSRPAVIARGGYPLNPTPYQTASVATPRQGLMPAAAYFVSPVPQPAPFAGYPTPAPSRPAMADAPMPSPMPVMRPAERPQPQQRPAPAPVRAAQSASAPSPQASDQDPAQTAEQASGAPWSNDPMAPRRDAPIFRIAPASQTPAAAPSEPAPQALVQAQATSANQSRYYSIHRQYGRQPDPTPTPAPVYLDTMPVDISGMSGSSDLAEPPAPPTLIRNNSGRLQALPDLSDTGL